MSVRTFVIIAALLFMQSCAQEGDAADRLPDGIKRLLAAYPQHLVSATAHSVVWADGTEMIFDDGVRRKSHDQLLNQPDLEDQFHFEYSLADSMIPPPYRHDPGRIRYEPFFRKMYGDSEEMVRGRLKPIQWLPNSINKTLYVTTVNDLDKIFQRLSLELDALGPAYRKYLEKPAGTFVWRKIAGTDRLSTHSFGMTIDINVDYSHYWRWDKTYSYRNKIPMEIVEVFEEHGFIWGGRWYHYDTMHFEYRPELLINQTQPPLK